MTDIRKDLTNLILHGAGLLACLVLILFAFSFGRGSTVHTELTANFNKAEDAKVTIQEDDTWKSTKDYVYIKYKAAKNGFVKLKFKDLDANSPAYGYVAICDKAKNILSAQDYYKPSSKNKDYTKLYYGVKKNTTYYFRVKATHAVSIKLTAYSVSDKSGVSPKKATQMKAKTYYKGLIPAGNSDADYFKIVLTKATKIRFYYTAYTNRTLAIAIYATNAYMEPFYASYNAASTEHSFVTNKLPAGTYYVAIVPDSVNMKGLYVGSTKDYSSGAYKIKYKKVS